MTKQEKIAQIEKRMRFLFELPIEMMSDNANKHYKQLETEWKELNRNNVNAKMALQASK